MTVRIKFDASLGEEDSGACFEINARDQKHAKQIADWLRSKCGPSNVYITAVQIVAVEVIIEV